MAVDLSSAPKAPPRNARQSRPTTNVVDSYRSPKAKDRQDAADGIFQLACFGLVMGHQYADAGAIGKYGPNIAKELATLADKNDGVAKLLDYLTEAGPYAGLITATMPLVIQLMVNHKMLKAEHVAGAGIVDPAALSAEVRADMARQTAVALRKQQEAEAELRNLAAETKSANGENPATE